MPVTEKGPDDYKVLDDYEDWGDNSLKRHYALENPNPDSSYPNWESGGLSPDEILKHLDTSSVEKLYDSAIRLLDKMETWIVNTESIPGRGDNSYENNKILELRKRLIEYKASIDEGIANLKPYEEEVNSLKLDIDGAEGSTLRFMSNLLAGELVEKIGAPFPHTINNGCLTCLEGAEKYTLSDLSGNIFGEINKTNTYEHSDGSDSSLTTNLKIDATNKRYVMDYRNAVPDVKAKLTKFFGGNNGEINEVYLKGTIKRTDTGVVYICNDTVYDGNNLPLGEGVTIQEEMSYQYENDISNPLGYEIKEGTDFANEYFQAIKDNKEEIMKHYPDLTSHEYDEIAKRAVGILYKESKGGTSAKYLTKEAIHSSVKNESYMVTPGMTTYPGIFNAEYGAVESVKGEYSRGGTQIKFNTVFSTSSDKQFLKEFDINSGDDLADPRKCGVATMIGLITLYYDKILPMKTDPFWTNEATVIFLEFGNGKKDSIAIDKPLKIDGTVRPRTEAEREALIKEWSDNRGGLVSREPHKRPPLSGDDFFDYLYYARNCPDEINYGTATCSVGSYAAKAKEFANQYVKKLEAKSNAGSYIDSHKKDTKS